jgi:hypothetical protein
MSNEVRPQRFRFRGLGGTRPRPPDNEELVVFTLASEPIFRGGGR